MPDSLSNAPGPARARPAPRGAPDDETLPRRLEPSRPLWQRLLWVAGGVLMLAIGIAGAFLPLLPTTPFVLLAAFCFSRGSERCERWLLAHPRLGPIVRDWREHHAVPLRAKQLAWVMMAGGVTWAAFGLPPPAAGLAAVVCAATAWWLWRLPTRRAGPPAG